MSMNSELEEEFTHDVSELELIYEHMEVLLKHQDEHLHGCALAAAPYRPSNQQLIECELADKPDVDLRAGNFSGPSIYPRMARVLRLPLERGREGGRDRKQEGKHSSTIM